MRVRYVTRFAVWCCKADRTELLCGVLEPTAKEAKEAACRVRLLEMEGEPLWHDPPPDPRSTEQRWGDVQAAYGAMWVVKVQVPKPAALTRRKVRS